MKKNKIVLFVLALVLLAGIIIVCLKGFNVSLNLRAHDTLKFVFDTKFKMNDITKVCDDVFKDKEYEIKTVEVFSDAVYIISPTISIDEEKALLEKLDNLYKEDEEAAPDAAGSDATDATAPEAGTENPDATTDGANRTSEDPGAAGSASQEQSILEKLEEGAKYELYHDSKIRIRDIVRPYEIPSAVCALVVILYIAIRYNKLGNFFVVVVKTVLEMALVLLEVLSVIAITRVPVTTTIVPIVMIIVVIALCIRFAFYERDLENLSKKK